MFYTYVLLCTDKTGGSNFYTGSCDDLQERYKKHKSHSVKTTKKFAKIKLIYYEACLNKKDALIRENQLKTGFGRDYLKRRLNNSLKDLRE